jgi:hypothetical protein
MRDRKNGETEGRGDREKSLSVSPSLHLSFPLSLCLSVLIEALDALRSACYHDRAQEIQAIAGGLDPHEESPSSIEHAAG